MNAFIVWMPDMGILPQVEVSVPRWWLNIDDLQAGSGRHLLRLEEGNKRG